MPRRHSRANLALAPETEHTTPAAPGARSWALPGDDVRRPHVHRWRSPNLLASFGHALHGLVELTATERNMKLHVWTGLGVCVVASEVRLPMAAQLAVLITTALVLGAEAVNSAFEALVDLHTTERREEARRVKDAAAGAVLAFSAGAVAVAGVVVSRSWQGSAPPLDQLWAHILWDCAIVVLGGSLLALRTGRAFATIACALGGVALLALLAVRTVSLPFTGVALALFLLAVASARHSRLHGRCDAESA